MNTIGLLAKGNFIIDLYAVTIHIYVNDTYKNTVNQLKDIYSKKGLAWVNEEEAVSGYAVSIPNKKPEYYLLYAAEELDYNTIAHEAWHVTHYILEFVGIDSELGGETGAYLNGYIVDRVIAFLLKNKINIKNGKY